LRHSSYTFLPNWVLPKFNFTPGRSYRGWIFHAVCFDLPLGSPAPKNFLYLAQQASNPQLQDALFSSHAVPLTPPPLSFSFPSLLLFFCLRWAFVHPPCSSTLRRSVFYFGDLFLCASFARFLVSPIQFSPHWISPLFDCRATYSVLGINLFQFMLPF